MKKRVVITGMGVITPIGNDVATFWKNNLNATNGVNKIQAFDTEGLAVKIAAEVLDFRPDEYLTPKESKRMDRVTQFGMAACQQALESSELLKSDYNPERVGVVTGSGIGGISTLEQQHKILLKGKARFVSPFFIPMMIADIIPGHISIKWNFKGPNYSIASACATSTHAIGTALRHILSDEADIMITGGSEASITPMAIAGFTNMKALSQNNEAPAKASRPFDQKRDGFVVGEGAGIIVLEELNHARQRNAPIFGEIIGYGFTADAHHITAPHPSGEGAIQAMRIALQMGNVSKQEVSYINAHGTSTQLNDKSETMAIKSLFGDHAYQLQVSSTKSMVGHLLGAAGAVEFIAMLKALEQQVIPPTRNYEHPDPECDLNYTPNQLVEKDFNIALSNNFGFGGHNAVLVAKRYLPE